MPLRQDDDLELSAEETGEPRQGSRGGETVQLGAEFLSYARERFDAPRFKDELVRRLLPTVPRQGRPRATRPGETFGKFEVVEKLGKGGMATVYRVIDPERDAGNAVGARARDAQAVALKVMKPEIAHNPDYVRRFLREAANTALIDHPNVVQVYEVGSVAGRLYFTMELIDGATLKEHLKEHGVSETQGVQILCQLVDGLVAAHDRGVGHRDLKPSNLMLLTSDHRYGFGLKGDFDVVVKVTDFGLSQMLDTDQSDIMPGGRFLGTAKYVAPEVVKGAAPTLKSDVFSLGIMAFAMFAGRSPFKARNKVEYIAANLQAKAPLLDTVVDVSGELAHLVDCMLIKDPANRPEASALRRDLERLKRRGEIGEPVVVTDDPTSVFHTQSAGSKSRGLPVPPAALAAAALALLVLILGIAAVGGDEPAVRPLDRPDPRDPEDPPGGRPPRDPSAPNTPDTTPDAPVEKGLLAPIDPKRLSFGDQLARIQFAKTLAAGDAAWKDGDARGALERWDTASRLLGGRPPERLAARLSEAFERVALTEGAEAEAASEFAKAQRIYEVALQNRAHPDELRKRLARLEGLVSQEGEFKRRLRRAKVRAKNPAKRASALDELKALRPLATSLGRDAELERELEAAQRLGPGAPDTAEESSEALWRKASDLLNRGLHDPAEAAIASLESRGETRRTQVLRARLERSRATPAGMILVERPGEAPEELAKGLYVSEGPITNGAYARWFAEASQKETLAPPRDWQGATVPPAGSEGEAVRGVRRSHAKKFAEAHGGRLLTDADYEHLEALLGPLERPDGARTYPDGFRLVQDP